MLLNDDEIKETMESPLNLLNRLRQNLDKATSIIPSQQNHTQIPVLPPTADQIINNLDDKIRDTTTRSKAVKILNAAMDELERRLPAVDRPERLASIATEMSKIVSHQDNKGASDKLQSQIIVYAPQIQNIANYDIVEVAE